MSGSAAQFVDFIKALPLSKKISILLMAALLAGGFILMFLWTNQTDYQTLFADLGPEDGSAIIAKLEERHVPYQIGGGGRSILVPASEVYALRLSLAGEGLPSGGTVGFEIFDKTDFKTTKFVQELNYRRALQGELARTINQFDEVRASRVFIVIPKESLFVEERQPASASIQLDLTSSLPPGKLVAIVHLVSNAVEGLSADQVTVVDTQGRLIFKGDSAEESAFVLSETQLAYKSKVESEIRHNVQSMLEGIVGHGRAIVRVSADVDFNKITLNAEEYDPLTTAVRSERRLEETTVSGAGDAEQSAAPLNERLGVLPGADASQNARSKKDTATNYEINKITRTVLKPAGSILRLSVAAVIDGTYEAQQTEAGETQKKFVPRSPDELRQFEEMIKNAIGYNADREDQVSVTSVSFAASAPAAFETPPAPPKMDPLQLLSKYGKTAANFVLVLIVFLMVVRPILKSLKAQVHQAAGTQEQSAIPVGAEAAAQIEEPPKTLKTRAIEKSTADPDRAAHLIKGWIGEQSS